MTERTSRRRPGQWRIRRPATRRGWLISIAVGGAILVVKLIVGLSVLEAIVHVLRH